LRIGSGVRCAGCFDRTTVRVARQRPEKKREPEPPATIRVLPMQLQVGDRLADETEEWKVIGRPFKTVATVHGKDERFFGFQASRKNLVTNVFVLAVACVVTYRYAPRGGLLNAIYRNDVLTTGALIVGFFAADILGPFVLKSAIIVLSRLRQAAAFFTLRVNP
jgi:hypothetical protein